MTALAIIPARGGSKGIPRKNAIPLCGKPLVAWSIEAARQATRVDRVVVSTDDPEIAGIARQWGAEAVIRPAEISGDTASSEAALLDCIDQIERREASVPELVVFLQCTSPLTSAEDIDATVETLLASEADSALAVTDFHYFLWREGASGAAEGVNHDLSVRLLRQEQLPNYLESGAIYVMRTAGFRAARHRFFGKTVFHVMPRERCWEIDEPVDLEVAEVLLRRQGKRLRADQIPASLAALVLDFDGVFTDNRALILQDGTEAVTCDRSDGLAISLLRQTGIDILVLSGETNAVVAARCRKLGIECRSGIREKWPVLQNWLTERGIEPRDVAYVGNEINDLECLQQVGCGIVPRDAYRQVRSAARIVLSAAGGHGAIRELAELILQRLGEHCDVRSA
jgi:YrbI family 3-deoxy-D-manno-octulosonate 8-phosphate phosphatase